MPWELVIFGCDGVLVDSERQSNGVLAEAISELGGSLSTDEVLARFKGQTMPQVWQAVAAELGSALPEDVDSRFRKRQLRVLSETVTAMPGVDAVLDRLTMPFCVATNAPHIKMQTTLGATGLLPRFAGRMFSREDVPRPKPAPDLFLHAATTLGAAADRCVVVEDSPLGITAALAASMRPVGFAGASTGDRAALGRAGATVIDHMDQLVGCLETL